MIWRNDSDSRLMPVSGGQAFSTAARAGVAWMGPLRSAGERDRRRPGHGRPATTPDRSARQEACAPGSLGFLGQALARRRRRRPSPFGARLASDASCGRPARGADPRCDTLHQVDRAPGALISRWRRRPVRRPGAAAGCGVLPPIRRKPVAASSASTAPGSHVIKSAIPRRSPPRRSQLALRAAPSGATAPRASPTERGGRARPSSADSGSAATADGSARSLRVDRRSGSKIPGFARAA